jgi:hypothetical protein
MKVAKIWKTAVFLTYEGKVREKLFFPYLIQLIVVLMSKIHKL